MLTILITQTDWEGDGRVDHGLEGLGLPNQETRNEECKGWWVDAPVPLSKETVSPPEQGHWEELEGPGR